MTVFDGIGFAGLAILLVAYLLLQLGRFAPRDRGYLGMNIAASCLLLISLWHAPNWPSIATQACWIGISVYGLCRKGV